MPIVDQARPCVLVPGSRGELGTAPTTWPYPTVARAFQETVFGVKVRQLGGGWSECCVFLLVPVGSVSGKKLLLTVVLVGIKLLLFNHFYCDGGRNLLLNCFLLCWL